LEIRVSATTLMQSNTSIQLFNNIPQILQGALRAKRDTNFSTPHSEQSCHPDLRTNNAGIGALGLPNAGFSCFFTGAAGALMSAFEGYPNMKSGGWFLAAIPVGSMEFGNVGANLAIVPTYKDRLYGAISLQIKIKLY
jgi:hypothetical protein